MIDQLDILLDEVRPDEPVDDGFVDRVMVSVRTDRSSSWKQRRFFTRPAVLAAAAVLLAGGAVAAVKTTVTSGGRTLEPAASAGIASVTATQGGNPGTGAGQLSHIAVGGTSQRDATALPKTYRNGDYEWGYTSAHTAYVIDHSTGLRLQTETFTNSFTTRRARHVTLTLRNTGDQPLAVYAPEGCTLSVVEIESRDMNPSAGTARPTDPAAARTYACAGQRDGSTHKLVLPPGEAYTADANVSLPRDGRWGIVGMCQCRVVNPNGTTDGGDALGTFPSLLSGSTQTPLTGGVVGGGGASADSRLFTPPIAVQATR